MKFKIGDILYLRSGLSNYVIYPALGPWKITKVLIDEYEVTLGTTGMLYRYPKNIFVQSNEVNNYSHSHFSNCIINADSIANCEFHNCTINSVTQDIKTACINLIASQKDIREVILAFSKARGSIFSRTCKNDNCVNPDHIMFYCMDE